MLIVQRSQMSGIAVPENIHVFVHFHISWPMSMFYIVTGTKEVTLTLQCKRDDGGGGEMGTHLSNIYQSISFYSNLDFY